MGRVLHGSVTPTAIQYSQESLRTLAKRYGINQKTVRKWKGRASVADSEPVAQPATARSSRKRTGPLRKFRPGHPNGSSGWVDEDL